MDHGEEVKVFNTENQQNDSDSSKMESQSSDRSQEIENKTDVYLDVLKSKFSHYSFRKKQLDIIRAVIEEKRDVCVIMASGAGKSLCFQFPAVYTNGITLVICPLISLMKAQVLALDKIEISACLLGSAQEDEKILDRIKNDEFQIIYCCPEFFTNTGNKLKLFEILEGKLTLIAIDEAHVS